MEVLGWIVLVVVSLYVSFATAFCGYAITALGGKLDKAMLIPVAAAVALWYIVVNCCPFTIISK